MQIHMAVHIPASFREEQRGAVKGQTLAQSQVCRRFQTRNRNVDEEYVAKEGSPFENLHFQMQGDPYLEQIKLARHADRVEVECNVPEIAPRLRRFGYWRCSVGSVGWGLVGGRVRGTTGDSAGLDEFNLRSTAALQLSGMS